MKRLQWAINSLDFQYMSLSCDRVCFIPHVLQNIPEPRQEEQSLEHIICMKSVIQSDKSLTFGEETKQLG